MEQPGREPAAARTRFGRLVHGLRDPRFALAGALLLLLWLQLRAGGGFWNELELHVWDEVYYRQLGASALRLEFWPDFWVWSPVYALFAALAGHLAPPEHASDLVLLLAMLLACSAVFALARVVTDSLRAFALTCLWIQLVPVFVTKGAFVAPGVMLFTFGLFVHGLAGLARGARWLGPILLVLAAWCRAEYAAAVLLLGGALLMRRSLRSGLVLTLPALATLLLHGMTAVGQARGFMAFGQHYAAGVAGTAGVDVQAMWDWEPYVRADFGAAGSVLTALLANPGAFVEHVLRNVLALPRAGAEIFASFGASPFVIACAVLVLVGAPPDVRGPLARRIGRLGLAWAQVTVLFALLVLPRPELLLPMILWLLVLAASIGRQLATSFAESRAAPLQRLALPLAVVLALCAGAARFDALPRETLVTRWTVRELAGMSPRPAQRLLALHAGAFVELSGQRGWQALDSADVARDPAVVERFERESPTLVLWTDLDTLLWPPEILGRLGGPEYVIRALRPHALLFEQRDRR